jgi:hypothetical protein
MSEKVIREFKVIETDEGFRIEINGDKEQLRGLIDGISGQFGGRGWGFSPFGGHGHGPFGGRGHGHGPFAQHLHEHGPFGHPVPPAPGEGEPEDFHFGPRKLHEAAKRMRRFGGRWEARWGYDLGPWWDEGAAPSEGMTPTGDPSADV